MGDAFKIVHFRTPAVQHKKLTKKYFFIYVSMGVRRYENLIL